MKHEFFKAWDKMQKHLSHAEKREVFRAMDLASGAEAAARDAEACAADDFISAHDVADALWAEALDILNKINVVICTRHAATVEWLAAQGITGPVLAQVDDPAQITGKVVVGNLPLHLAAQTAKIGSIDLPGLRREQRGADLSVEEMDAAGACIRWYCVEAIG